jgi:hypothetical protein
MIAYKSVEVTVGKLPFIALTCIILFFSGTGQKIANYQQIAKWKAYGFRGFIFYVFSVSFPVKDGVLNLESI